MNRYVAGRQRGTRLVIYGIVEAEDIVCATIRAQRKWPGCGVTPWHAATNAQREKAMAKTHAKARAA